MNSIRVEIPPNHRLRWFHVSGVERVEVCATCSTEANRRTVVHLSVQSARSDWLWVGSGWEVEWLNDTRWMADDWSVEAKIAKQVRFSFLHYINKRIDSLCFSFVCFFGKVAKNCSSGPIRENNMSTFKIQSFNWPNFLKFLLTSLKQLVIVLIHSLSEKRHDQVKSTRSYKILISVNKLTVHHVEAPSSHPHLSFRGEILV